MNDESDGYHTYLLRVWRAQYCGHWQWHASLENPCTGERLTFATLDELSRYLESRPVASEIMWNTDPEAFPPPGNY